MNNLHYLHQKLRYWLTCLFLIITLTNIQSQIWLDNESIYKEAEEYLNGEDYSEALPLYLLLESKEIFNSNIAYKIGNCYMNIPDKQNRAIPYLQVAIENITDNYYGTFDEVKAPQNSVLLLGLAYSCDYQFDKALPALTQYKDLVKGTSKEALADFQIKKIETAMKLEEQSTEIILSRLKDQSEYSLYNPVVSIDSHIFYMESRPFYDAIIEAQLIDEAILLPENITSNIGSDGNMVLLDISPDGKLLVLRKFNDINGYDLFYSQKDEKGKWKKAIPFPEPVNSKFNEFSGSISDDGNTMFFTSNRVGGIGGYDVYTSEKLADNSWGEAKNLGSKINTTFNESYVTVANNSKKLYFSSESHLNMGYEDLFFTNKLEDGTWNFPTNFGNPVSTPRNDAYISPSTDSLVFYMHRVADKVDDKLRLYKIKIANVIIPHKTLVKGTLAFTNEIPPARVKYQVVDLSDSTLFIENTTSPTGEYSFLVNEGNYNLNFTYNEKIKANQSITITKNFPVDEVILEIPEWEVYQEILPPRIVYLEDILFAFNSTNLDSKYTALLDSIADIVNKENTLQITLTGHTDAIGDDGYNQKLSEKRAKAVYDYLIEKGIDSHSLSMKGKGENQPAAKNLFTDGSDNIQGRKYNRRVVIEILNLPDNYLIIRKNIIPTDLLIER